MNYPARVAAALRWVALTAMGKMVGRTFGVQSLR
jgi:hypothetical protein